MNPDLFRWFFVWIILCVILFLVIGFYWVLDPLIRLLIATNTGTMLLMFLDKCSASLRLRRVPERMMYVATFLGGSIGMLLAIHLFRHKSRKVSFQFVVGVLILVQMMIIAWIKSE